MKKLIFLLIMAVLMIGIMPAQNAAHPPGDISLEAAMSGYSVDNLAVTPDTVQVITRFEFEPCSKSTTIDNLLFGFYLIKPA